MCGKCGCMKLCPCSFGLALGFTCALAMFLCSLWLMYFGALPMMTVVQLPVPTFKEAAILSSLSFVKGFVFGFVVVLLYDTIVSVCKKKECCKKAAESCCCNKDKSDASK